MRIISGKYKGRQINPPKSIRARPTTDYAKEALFNVLENRFDLEETNVLDLFAGTGNISFEFASRNVKRIVIVEKDRVHVSFIAKTVKNLQLAGVDIIRGDVFQVLKRLNESFDIIFCDPPYHMEDIHLIPSLVMKNNLLTRDGILIIEHSSRVILKDLHGFVEHRYYGNVNFSFFQFTL
ncbi:MAG: 16S rRNA (guanine(966)-N(2))-methyltransferase RsmD [Bacteroidales bacterium]